MTGYWEITITRVKQPHQICVKKISKKRTKNCFMFYSILKWQQTIWNKGFSSTTTVLFQSYITTVRRPLRATMWLTYTTWATTAGCAMTTLVCGLCHYSRCSIPRVLVFHTSSTTGDATPSIDNSSGVYHLLSLTIFTLLLVLFWFNLAFRTLTLISLNL